jgi:hypothetical protein
VNTGTAVLVALGVLGAAPLISALYGAAFRFSESVLIWLSAATVISAAASAVGMVIASLNEMWIGAVLNLIWAGVFLGGIFFPGRAINAANVSTAFLFAYVVHGATTAWYAGYRMRHLP